MGCAVSSASSTSYQVQPFNDEMDDHVYDKLWRTLPGHLLFRCAAIGGIGAWRLNLVCRGYRDTLRSVPRRVRFVPQAPEQLAEQIAWLRKCGARAEGWRLEAMGDKGAMGVSQALRCNTSLVDVGVYRGRRKEATLGLRGASKIAIAIGANEGVRLQRLDLSGSSIKDFGAQKLCRALSSAATTLLGGSTLAHLDLARNGIKDKGALAVAAYIAAEGRSPSNGQALRRLVLTSNGITEEGAVAIADAVSSGGSRIESITLSENDLGSEHNGPATLVRLMMHSTMQTIQLSGCSINPEGADKIVTALEKADPAPALTSLDLSGNSIKNSGGSVLGRMLTSGGCPCLTTLNVARCGIGNTGAAELAVGVRAETCAMHRLDVSGNIIGDDGAIALAQALDPSGSRGSSGLVKLSYVSTHQHAPPRRISISGAVSDRLLAFFRTRTRSGRQVRRQYRGACPPRNWMYSGRRSTRTWTRAMAPAGSGR